MPQHFYVAVISSEWGVSSAAVAVLGGSGYQGISPYLIPSSVYTYSQGKHKWLLKAGCELGLMISESVNALLLDPRHLDVWLALDRDAERYAQQQVKKYGPRRKGFYRRVFPAPVVYCGFDVPSMPTGFADSEAVVFYKEWFDQLRILFEPWHERIWKAFSDSS